MRVALYHWYMDDFSIFRDIITCINNFIDLPSFFKRNLFRC